MSLRQVQYHTSAQQFLRVEVYIIYTGSNEGVFERQPAPSLPRHTHPLLPLLPSGPDGIHNFALRGDRHGPP